MVSDTVLWTFIACTTFPVWMPCLLHGASWVFDVVTGERMPQ